MCHDYRGLLDPEELGLLKRTVEIDADIRDTSYDKADGRGKSMRMALWDDPSDDITGAIARAEKVAGTFEKVNFVKLQFETTKEFEVS